MTDAEIKAALAPLLTLRFRPTEKAAWRAIGEELRALDVEHAGRAVAWIIERERDFPQVVVMRTAVRATRAAGVVDARFECRACGGTGVVGRRVAPLCRENVTAALSAGGRICERDECAMGRFWAWWDEPERWMAEFGQEGMA